MSMPMIANRRSVLMAGSFLGGLLSGDNRSQAKTTVPGAKGPTNEVVKNINGMKYRRLGGSDILVSELGLGTQRWASADFNGPDEKLVFEFMDK